MRPDILTAAVLPASASAANFRQGKSLDDLLIEASQIGHVWLATSKHVEGWKCSIDAHISAAGTTVEFKSDFRHATPIEAVEQCLARARAAMEIMSGRANG